MNAARAQDARDSRTFRLPIHPGALTDESPESYILRLAFSNVLSLIGLRLQWALKRRCDLNSMDQNLAWFQKVTSEYPRQTVSLRSLQCFEPTLGRWWRSWLTPIALRRYCPACLAEDRVPYLRLAWRLNFVVACTRHNALLESKCGHCSSQLKPVEPNDYYSIARCNHCGALLSQTKPRKPNPSPGLAVMTRLTAAAYGLGTATLSDLSVEQPLDGMLFLISFLRRTHGIGPKDIRSGDAIRTDGGFIIPCDGQVYLTILGQAWALLNDREKLLSFIRVNQAEFNQVTRGWKASPQMFREYVRPAEYTRCGKTIQVGPRTPIDWDRVRHVATQIAHRGQLASKRRVAKEIGVNYETFLRRIPPQTSRYLQALMDSRLDYRLKRISEAIMSMKVCYPVKYPHISKVTGIKQSKMMRTHGYWVDQRIEEAFHDAEIRRKRYFSSFRCDNPSCEGAPMRFRRVYGKWREGHYNRVTVGCATCRRVMAVDVSMAPTHGEYVRSMDRSRGGR